MAFRKLEPRPRSGRAQTTSVRIRHLGNTAPAIIIPLSVASLAGIDRGSTIDVMVDDGAALHRIAIVADGSDLRVSQQRENGPLSISAASLRTFLPKMRTTPVSHEIGPVDGRMAVIFSAPKRQKPTA